MKLSVIFNYIYYPCKKCTFCAFCIYYTEIPPVTAPENTISRLVSRDIMVQMYILYKTEGL